MKKRQHSPKIITDFLDQMIASGRHTITARELVKQSGVTQQSISCIFSNLKRGSKYKIETDYRPGFGTTYTIGLSTKTEVITASVKVSGDIIDAWRRVATNPNQRVFIPAFWPAAA